MGGRWRAGDSIRWSRRFEQIYTLERSCEYRPQPPLLATASNVLLTSGMRSHAYLLKYVACSSQNNCLSSTKYVAQLACDIYSTIRRTRMVRVAPNHSGDLVINLLLTSVHRTMTKSAIATIACKDIVIFHFRNCVPTTVIICLRASH